MGFGFHHVENDQIRALLHAGGSPLRHLVLGPDHDDQRRP
jgi:hypothetical protein